MIIKKLIKLYKKNSFYLNFLPHNFQKKEIKKDPQLISNMFLPSIELQEIAVIENGYNLQYITNPTDHIIQIALNQNLNSFELIQKPTEEIQFYFIKLAYEKLNFFIIEFFLEKISSPLALKKLENLISTTIMIDDLKHFQKTKLQDKIKNSKYYKNDANIILDYIKKGG